MNKQQKRMMKKREKVSSAHSVKTQDEFNFLLNQWFYLISADIELLPDEKLISRINAIKNIVTELPVVARIDELLKAITEREDKTLSLLERNEIFFHYIQFVAKQMWSK
jgi:hypothetical protein